MTRGQSKRVPLRILVGAACGIWALAYPVAGQEGPGDQKFSFNLNQRIGVNDNIRLDPVSVGTTYFSDTALSFGFNSQTGIQRFDLTLDGVFRYLDDPVSGSTSGFADPSLALLYSRDSVDSRLTLTARYARPDLAFLDPFQQDQIDNQDLFRGDGRREDYQLGIRLETGLAAPLGFNLNLSTTGRRYSDTTDPTLFDNRTDSAALGARLQFSPVTQGRVNLSEDRFTAQDLRGTNRTTRRLTFGVVHEFSPVTTLSANIGQSEVIETFDALVGLENVTRGPVGSLALTRAVPDGAVSASLDTTLSVVGRQTNLQVGRTFELPAGGLEVSFGASKGSGFSLLPIGSIVYDATLPTGSLRASLSRGVTISSTQSRAEISTRVAVGYNFDINTVSSIALNLDYADISLTGTGAGPDRTRANFSATYTRDLTRDWDIEVGYQRRYSNSSTTSSAASNLVFMSLQRDFDVFR